ncbi:PrgI family protein [Patescibacteria group bacterium]|nr:MAG: PrgI family protein [Patescibacteria group bacterium]
MLIGVPQFIDVEDKIAGPLTAKQLLWMMGMGATFLVLWFVLEQAAFFVAVGPIAAIFLGFAFYRPYNQTLLTFVMHSISFVFRPKVYVWKREAVTVSAGSAKKVEPKKPTIAHDQQISRADIAGLAGLLDTEGTKSSTGALELIRQHELERDREAKRRSLLGGLSITKKR